MRVNYDAVGIFLWLIRRFQKKLGDSIKSAHTDGRTEFKRSLDVLYNAGLDTTSTADYTPWCTGLAERTHGDITSIDRSCMLQSHFLQSHWNFSIQDVDYYKNSVQNSTTKDVYMDVFAKQLNSFLLGDSHFINSR